MRWPRAYPGRKRRAGRKPRIPRRARRGLSALTGVMLLAALVVPAVSWWQIAQAQERIRGYGRHIADVIAAEGYGLHHWLHQENIAGTLTNTPATGAARAMTTAENTALASHSATTSWRRSSTDSTRVLLPRGWTMLHLIGTPENGQPDGVLVLRPSADLTGRPTWAVTRRAVEIALDAEIGGPAVDLATTALSANARPFNPTRDIAVLASRLSRLDTDAVLREYHAGQGDQRMETDIILGTNTLTNVNVLQADNGRLPAITGTGAGGVLAAQELSLDAGLEVKGATTLQSVEAADVTLTGTATGIITIQAKDVTLTGNLNTADLTACADAGADLCGGGDLDIRSASGTPGWTSVRIFRDLETRPAAGTATLDEVEVLSDVIIRNDNSLTGVRRTTVTGTGIFGNNIPGDGDGLTTDALTVRDCLRSTAPFIYSRGC